MMRKQFAILVLCLLPFAGQSQVRKYTNSFLGIGVGARALGMGNSLAAGSGDVTAGYWNPAGLLGLTGKFQLSVMHSPYFSGISNYDYAAIAKKLDENNAIGLSYIRLGIDNIPNTLDLRSPDGQIDYSRVKSFSAADMAFLLSYAHLANNNKTRLGATAKIIRRKIGTFASATGFGFDVGALHKADDWVFGITGRDITFTFTAWKMNFTDDQKDKLIQAGQMIPKSAIESTPPSIIAAVGRTIQLNDDFTLYPELDLNINFDGKRNTLIKTSAASIAPTMGIEGGYKKMVFVRTGLQNFQTVYSIDGKKTPSMQWTVGAGIKLKAFCLDYAFTDIGNVSAALYSHVFSLKFIIGEEGE